MHYLHRDVQISITNITNSSGTEVAEYSYTAWGRMRNPTDWTEYAPGTEPALLTGRGYTGHEHLNMFRLINMNARLYDPVLGRMLSPDNYMQTPDFSQNYNRYAYCVNNPVMFIDPSGEKLNWPKFTWFNAIPVIGQFDYIMEFINANTTEVRQKMIDAGVPDFSVGTSISSGGKVDLTGSYQGQQVFNTGNIDRSNAKQVVDMEISSEWQDYWQARANPQGQGGLGASTFFGAVGVGGDAASMSNYSFRLMSGTNGSFSPKVYSSGWNGGSPARITTYSVSKIGTGVSAGANLITTGLAYRDVFKGSAKPITYVDAGVGTIGLAASYASYFHGVEIPVVGEFVAVYGALRLSWDVGWYMGVNYGPSKWYGADNSKWFK